MQFKAKYHICYGFWYSPENTKKWSLRVTPKSFVKWKVSWRYSICSSQVINFQKFSWRWSIHELGHFGGFLDPNSPQNPWILVKLAPEVVLKEKNTVLKFLWQIPIFTETAAEKSLILFSVFAQLWGPFTPWRKPKSKKLSIFADKI